MGLSYYHPNFGALTQPLYLADNFAGQKFKESLTGQFSRGVSRAVAVRCWLGLQSSGGVPGLGVQDGAPTGPAVDVGWLQA